MKKTHLIVLIVCICVALGLGILIGSGVLGGKKTKTETGTENPTAEAGLTPTTAPTSAVTPTPTPTAAPTPTVTPTPTEAPTPEALNIYPVKRVVRAESPYGSVVCSYDPEDGRLTEKVSKAYLEFRSPSEESIICKDTYEYLEGIKLFREHRSYDEGAGYRAGGFMLVGNGGLTGSLETYFDGILRIAWERHADRPDSLDFCLSGGEWNLDRDSRGRVTAMYFLKADDRFSRVEYDQAGNPVKRTDFDPSGHEIRRCEFMYNDAGQLVGARNPSADEQDIYYVTYQYDTDGRLLTGTFYRKGGNVAMDKRFFYDEDGDILEIRESVEDSNEDIVLTYQYEIVNVREDYLTNKERMDLGLPYDPEWVMEPMHTIDPYLWQVFSDLYPGK